MTNIPKFQYQSVIKLTPAIGDWTAIRTSDLSQEEVNISDVVNVNFDRLSQTDLRYLQLLHYRFADHAAQKLSMDLDTKVELHSVYATQISYEDFIAMQPPRLTHGKLAIQSVGNVGLVMDWGLADRILRYLTAMPSDVQRDAFTDLELSMITPLLEELFPLFSEAWGSIFTPGHLSLTFSSGPYQPDRTISYRDAYIFFSFYFYFGDDQVQKVILGYSNELLRRLLAYRRSLPNSSERRVRLMPQTLRALKVSVKAVLGATTLSMKDVRSLQVGDIISLDAPIDAALTVDVGNSDVQIVCQPGISDSHLAIQLLNSQIRAQPVTLVPSPLPSFSAFASAPAISKPAPAPLPSESVFAPVAPLPALQEDTPHPLEDFASDAYDIPHFSAETSSSDLFASDPFAAEAPTGENAGTALEDLDDDFSWDDFEDDKV